MTEQQMPWQMRQSVAEKLSQMPLVNHNGWDVAPTEQPEPEPELPPAAEAEPAAPTGPQPDPSQGWQGQPVQSDASRLRNQLRNALNRH